MSTIDLIRNDRTARSFRQGEYIFKEGDRGEFMIALDEGQVDIVKGGRMIETIGPDGLFGEMALISNKPRSADAIAKTDCRVVMIDLGDFYFLIQHAPFFAITVMEILAERVRRNMEA